MKLAVIMTAYNRPDYLEESLSSWKSVRGLTEDIHFFVEPSQQLDAVLSIIAAAGVPYQCHVNPERYGELHNPWVAVDWAFSEGADFVVCAEDDDTVSSDILEYFKAAYELFNTDEVLGVSGYNSEALDNPDAASLMIRQYWGGLVWGTWRTSWYEHLRDTWDHDYSTFNGSPGNQSGFDWNINTRIIPRLGLGCVIPEVSRVHHIGRVGTHITPDQFETARSTGFQLHRTPGTVFRVVS